MATYHKTKKFTIRLFGLNNDKSISLYKLSIPTEALENFRRNQMELIKENERVYCSNAVGLTSRLFESEFSDMIIPERALNKLKKEKKHEFIPIKADSNGILHGSVANYINGRSVDNQTVMIQSAPSKKKSIKERYFILPQDGYNERNSMMGIVQVTRMAYILHLMQKGTLDEIEEYFKPTPREVSIIVNMFSLDEEKIIPSQRLKNLKPDSYVRGTECLTVKQLEKRIKSDAPFIKQIKLK